MKKRKTINKIIAAFITFMMVICVCLSAAVKTDAAELMAALDFNVIIDAADVSASPESVMEEDGQKEGDVSPEEMKAQETMEDQEADADQEAGEDQEADADQEAVEGQEPNEAQEAGEDQEPNEAQEPEEAQELDEDQEPDEGQEPSGEEKEKKKRDKPVVGAYTNGYDNRLYLSLRDLATVLKGTSKQFDFYRDVELDSFVITKGEAYEIPEPETYFEEGPEPQGREFYDEDGNLRDEENRIIWEKVPLEVTRPDYEYLDLYGNPLVVDGMPVDYFTYQLSVMQDLYMSILDVQLVLDITIEKDGEDTLHIYTENGFTPSLAAYDVDGFFDLFNGVLLGDATTGEILYENKGSNVDAIASTSKLMTYMVVARYLEMGKIHMDDEVELSWNVANLSQSGYGTLYMEFGQVVTVHDLLACLLLPSSNEASVALAEHVAGSEKEFVKLMNEMARLLGLDTAKFYNASGLPEYTDTLIASLVQNRMSAEDLFLLTRAILRKYPEITEFTSQTSMYLESFDFTVWNSNSLLRNLPECIGMKTGTTDEAGCCLVAAAKMKQEDGEHILVAIVLGADSNIDRYQIPHLLLKWGLNQKPRTSQIVY